MCVTQLATQLPRETLKESWRETDARKWKCKKKTWKVKRRDSCWQTLLRFVHFQCVPVYRTYFWQFCFWINDEWSWCKWWLQHLTKVFTPQNIFRLRLLKCWCTHALLRMCQSFGCCWCFDTKQNYQSINQGDVHWGKLNFVAIRGEVLS